MATTTKRSSRPSPPPIKSEQRRRRGRGERIDPDQRSHIDDALDIIRSLTRKEYEQKLKNLRRELDNANKRCAKMSQRIGRYRAANRDLRQQLAVKEIIQEQAATKAERRGHAASA